LVAASSYQTSEWFLAEINWGISGAISKFENVLDDHFVVFAKSMRFSDLNTATVHREIRKVKPSERVRLNKGCL
jgi:hypothetical protein